ncbi:MAG: phosphoribosylformylglycinamidine synthase I [Nitrososphaerota archaeon]|nr:phosphoribosylformylglycinamidine synthase I [Nitrososphaerales archaeon]MDW8044676.1 phosphoribosylformylglycinamidine synthase I [Nitrososphaerota archaeon]
MKVAVIRFPGSNCDLDTIEVLSSMPKVEPHLVWHEDHDIRTYDAIILPGGFSYGDYLRAGIIAAHSPIMNHVKYLAERGVPILGICNGFQILVEANLLPGALLRNSSLKFICKWVKIKVETNRTPFTCKLSKGEILRIPIAHNEGRYFIPRKGFKELHRYDQIVFRYVDESGKVSEEANPNGSIANIAGICNREGNVVGMMPHPERASQTILSPYRTEDGRKIFESLIDYVMR